MIFGSQISARIFCFLRAQSQNTCLIRTDFLRITRLTAIVRLIRQIRLDQVRIAVILGSNWYWMNAEFLDFWRIFELFWILFVGKIVALRHTNPRDILWKVLLIFKTAPLVAFLWQWPRSKRHLIYFFRVTTLVHIWIGMWIIHILIVGSEWLAQQLAIRMKE